MINKERLDRLDKPVPDCNNCKVNGKHDICKPESFNICTSYRGPGVIIPDEKA